jgi:hypothetical protein
LENSLVAHLRGINTTNLSTIYKSRIIKYAMLTGKKKTDTEEKNKSHSSLSWNNFRD